MDTKYELKDEAGQRPIVYVRPVEVEDLPDDIRPHLTGETRIYAVHNEEGERLALVKDERHAFLLALQNDFAPVHVH